MAIENNWKVNNFMHMEEHQYLNERITKLETGLEALTKQVADLASTVKENNSAVNTKLEALMLAIEKI